MLVRHTYPTPTNTDMSVHASFHQPGIQLSTVKTLKKCRHKRSHEADRLVPAPCSTDCLPKRREREHANRSGKQSWETTQTFYPQAGPSWASVEPRRSSGRTVPLEVPAWLRISEVEHQTRPEPCTPTYDGRLKMAITPMSGNHQRQFLPLCQVIIKGNFCTSAPVRGKPPESPQSQGAFCKPALEAITARQT